MSDKVESGRRTPARAPRVSKSQISLLRLSRSYPLRDGGVIEAQLHTGLQGAALEACIGALERRGYIDGQGWQTDKGAKRLAQVDSATHG